MNTADQLKAHGVDEIIALATNDQFTMEEWQKFYDPERKLTFLADPNAELAVAMGLDIDLSAVLGGGLRYARAVLEVDNGKVTKLDLEDMDGILKPNRSLAEQIVPAIIKAKPKKIAKARRKTTSAKQTNVVPLNN